MKIDFKEINGSLESLIQALLDSGFRKSVALEQINELSKAMNIAIVQALIKRYSISTVKNIAELKSLLDDKVKQEQPEALSDLIQFTTRPILNHYISAVTMNFTTEQKKKFTYILAGQAGA